jgi:hypothetical protein
VGRDAEDGDVGEVTSPSWFGAYDEAVRAETVPNSLVMWRPGTYLAPNRLWLHGSRPRNQAGPLRGRVPRLLVRTSSGVMTPGV